VRADGDGALPVAATLAGVSVALLTVALVLPAAALVAPAAAFLGAAYASALALGGDGPDVGAALVAAALLLVCELGYWSHELRTTAPDEAGDAPRRAGWLAGLAAVAFLVCAALLGVTDAVRVSGQAVDVAGVLLAAAGVAGVVLLVRGSRTA
jgi:hypothetical protein